VVRIIDAVDRSFALDGQRVTVEARERELVA
jgi:hypothetical protein